MAETYPTGEYPATVRIIGLGGSFVVVADDPEADPAEAELLKSFRMSAVLAAAAPADGGSWLAEIYADGPADALEHVEPSVRLLVAEAVRRRGVLVSVRSAVA